MKTISFQTKYLKDAHLFYRDYAHKDNTILFESAEIVDKSGVQSLIGISAALKVSCDDLKVKVEALNKNGEALLNTLALKLHATTDNKTFTVAYTRPDKNLDEYSRLKADGPMTVMRALQNEIKDCEGIFVGGVIAFDFINNFEHIGDVPKGKNPCSDYGFYLFDVCVRSNHQKQETTVSAYVFNEESYKETAFEALDIRDKIDSFDKEDKLDVKRQVKPLINPDLDDEKFGEIVGKIKQHIIQGDAFQIVPSRTFSYECKDPLLAYSYLKKLNPSPYMYYIKDPKFTIFGASPEKWEVDMEYGICAIWGNAPCRHYVVLVTSLGKDNNARCRIYETTGSDTYGFRRKVSELDSEDKTFSAIGEFWAKDQKGADVLVITPWLRRGTAQCVYTR